MFVEIFATREISRKLIEFGIDWVQVQKVDHLKVQHQFRVQVLLEGETEPVTINAHYAVSGNSVTVSKFTASKPWLERALTDFILPQINAQKLPEGILGAMAKWLL